MEKVIFCRSAITLSILAVSLISYGQTSTTALRASKEVAENYSGTLRRSDVNSKAVKDFTKYFKDISIETWFEAPDGLAAKFTLRGVDYRVDYDKKGNWLHTMRTYDESEMPADLRHVVRSTYYDYNIIVVQEIEQPRNNLTYIIHLEGKSTLINLRIHDGEIEEWQKFTKSE